MAKYKIRPIKRWTTLSSPDTREQVNDRDKVQNVFVFNNSNVIINDSHKKFIDTLVGDNKAM